MRNLQELLTGTIGLARLGREYADAIQRRAIDGSDHGIVVCSAKVFGHRSNNRATSENIEVTIERDSGMVELNSREVRDIFGVLYGMISAEFDEALETGEPKPSPYREDLKAALALLRTAVGVMGGEGDNPEEQKWFEETDALLARYPESALL